MTEKLSIYVGCLNWGCQHSYRLWLWLNENVKRLNFSHHIPRGIPTLFFYPECHCEKALKDLSYVYPYLHMPLRSVCSFHTFNILEYSKTNFTRKRAFSQCCHLVHAMLITTQIIHQKKKKKRYFKCLPDSFQKRLMINNSKHR